MSKISATPSRIVEAALGSFASRGFEATSLDAIAANLGITKQAILHHFKSKEVLLRAVMERVIGEVEAAIDFSLASKGNRFSEVETVVRTVYSISGERPELLGFLREVGRLDTEHNRQLAELFEPLTIRATRFLGQTATNNNASLRSVVIGAYAAVIASATEFEVLSQLGQSPTLRLVVRRRNELLSYLTDELSFTSRSAAPRSNS